VIRLAAASLFGTSIALLMLVSSRRLQVAGGGRRAPQDAVIGALGQVRRMLPSLVGLVGKRDVRLLIQRAGLDGRILPRDIAAARLVCILGAAMMLPRLIQMLPLRMLPMAAALLFVAAAEFPVWWLRKRGLKRSTAMRAALPDALELLRACLAAGLPLRRSLSLVGDHCAEPVATEFVCVSAETAFGIPQQTALDGLAARNPQPEIRALVASIRQAEKHGSPLAPVIAAQAQDARLALNREIVERGAKAGPKIQLIVSTTIVPAALLGMGAVVIAAIARGDIRFI
jgi:tight adherence protein C